MKINKVQKLNNLSIKEEDGKGIVSGIANKVDIIDKHNDIVKKGAFDKSVIDAPKVTLLYNHKQSDIIGVAKLSLDEGGSVMADAEFLLSTEKGREVYEIIKQHAKHDIPMGFSVGMRIHKHSFNEKGVRVFEDVEVRELSIVRFPANQESKINAVKNEKEQKTGEKEKMTKSEEKVLVENTDKNKIEINSLKAELKKENTEEGMNKILEKIKILDKKVETLNEIKKMSSKIEKPSLSITKEEIADLEEKYFISNLQRNDVLKQKYANELVKKAAYSTSQVTGLEGVFPSNFTKDIIEKIKEDSDVFNMIPSEIGKDYIGYLEGSDITVDYVDENTEIGEAALTTPVEFKVTGRKLAAITVMSNESKKWTTDKYKNHLRKKFIKGFTDKLENEIFNGTGENCKGLLTPVPNIVDHTTSSTNSISIADVENMIANLPSKVDKNAVWLMNKATYYEIFNKKDSNGAYLFRDSSDSISKGKKTLRGYPVIFTPYMAGINEAGKFSAILGSLKDGCMTLIGRNLEISADSSGKYWRTDQTALRGLIHFGFRIIHEKAFIRLKNKPTTTK